MKSPKMNEVLLTRIPSWLCELKGDGFIDVFVVSLAQAHTHFIVRFIDRMFTDFDARSNDRYALVHCAHTKHMVDL